MPISGPSYSTPTKKSKPKKEAPADPYAAGAADAYAPDEQAAMKDQGYSFYPDGSMVPPMEDIPGQKRPKAMPPGMQPGSYSNPGLAVANPGANQGGGPTGMQGDIRSDIFKQLYRVGKQSGNIDLMNMGMPPMEPEGPPEPPPFPSQEDAGPAVTMPPLPPAPQAPPMSDWPIWMQRNPAAMQQQKGMAGPASRFPRATSLVSGMTAGRKGY